MRWDEKQQKQALIEFVYILPTFATLCHLPIRDETFFSSIFLSLCHFTHCAYAFLLVRSYHRIDCLIQFCSSSISAHKAIDRREKRHMRKNLCVFLFIPASDDHGPNESGKKPCKTGNVPECETKKDESCETSKWRWNTWAVSFDAHHTSFDTVCVNWFGCALSHMPVIFRTASKWAKRGSFTICVRWCGAGCVFGSFQPYSHTHTLLYIIHFDSLSFLSYFVFIHYMSSAVYLCDMCSLVGSPIPVLHAVLNW